MPKLKLPTKTPHIDMTPMVDLFMLLLTFFMLTTTFRPSEAAVIDTPFSVSEKQAPEKNVMTVLVDKDNKIFFNVDEDEDTARSIRTEVLQEMGTRYQVTFTAEEIEKFKKLASFGVPMKHFKQWLNAADAKERAQYEIGIPIDSADNQLAMWILYSRLKNKNVDACIKGDNQADYKVVRKVLDVLQDNEVNKFSLTTNLQKEEVKLEE